MRAVCFQVFIALSTLVGVGSVRWSETLASADTSAQVAAGTARDDRALVRDLRPFFWLVALVSLKWLIGTLWQLGHVWPLAPDEAQYWTWSRHLDWGYYSKPPAIAWQIWASCAILRSNSALAVRAASGAMNWVTPFLLYRSCRCWGLGPRASFYSSLCLAFSPAGILGQFAATTDGGMILAWCGALGPLGTLLASSQQTKRMTFCAVELGLWIALGALYKWTMLFFFPLALCCPKLWRLLRRQPSLGALILLIAAFGLIPSAYWNARHGGVTLRHVFGQILGNSSSVDKLKLQFGHLFGFLGGQMLLFSPWLLAPFFYRAREIFRAQRTRALAVFSWVSLLIFASMSCSRRIQANWLVFTYPTIFLCIGALCHAEQRARQLLRAVIYSTAFSIVILMIPHWQGLGAPFPLALNPFQQCLGWDRLKAVLDTILWAPNREFIISDTYSLTAELQYITGRTGSDSSIAQFNFRSMRRNGYDEEFAGNKWRGKAAFYATLEQSKDGRFSSLWIDEALDRLAPYFRRVEFVVSKVLVEHEGHPRKWLILCKGYGYNGKRPKLGAAH